MCHISKSYHPPSHACQLKRKRKKKKRYSGRELRIDLFCGIDSVAICDRLRITVTVFLFSFDWSTITFFFAVKIMKLEWEEVKLAPDPVHGVPIERSSHGVSLLRRGTVLFLYGGEHIARTPITEPTQQVVWTAHLSSQQHRWQVSTGGITGTNIGPSPRVAHAQAVHRTTANDGTVERVYVFGGRTGVQMQESPLNDLWAWRDDTETWDKIHDTSGTPPEPRSFHRMVCMDDSLYVFGGCGASGRLADLHRFDVLTRTWYALTPSTLRGRGGANLIALPTSQKILVWGGFAGEEMCDGQIYDIRTDTWGTVELSESVRPRSVCVAGTLAGKDDGDDGGGGERIVIFGGEVNSSDRGHEGAGGFAQDVVLMRVVNDSTSPSKVLLKCQQGDAIQPGTSTSVGAPSSRGWSAGDTYDNVLYLFGGLSGDDTDPKRLGDLWKLTVHDN